MSRDSIYMEWDGGVVYRHKTLPYACRMIGESNFLIFERGEWVGEWDEPRLLNPNGLEYHMSLLGFVLEVRNLEQVKGD